MKYYHIAILTVVFIMALCARVSEGQDTGTWEAWGSWMIPPCAVTCGRSVRIIFKTRNCLNGTCSGDAVKLNQTTCGTDNCITGFTPWGDWENSSCSLTCGQGKITRRRTRECTGTCVGDTVEHSFMDCVEEECRVHGGWTLWSVWTTPLCTVTCGTDTIGRAKRIRSCGNPSPGFGGNACVGADEEFKTQNCELDLCPVDGNWTAWSSWTTPNCPTTCESEVTVTVRKNCTCTKPSPMFGGKDCFGENEESATRECKLEICPDKDSIIGIIIGMVVIFIIILSSVTVYLVRKYKTKRTHKDTETPDTNIGHGEEQNIELEARSHSDYEKMTDLRGTRSQHNPYTELEHANTEPVGKRLSDYEVISGKHAMEHPYTGLTETSHYANEVLPQPCLSSSDDHTYINLNADQRNNRAST